MTKEELKQKFSNLYKKIEQLVKENGQKDKQLTKAIELLKHWANSYGGIDVALCKQTQKFLSEVEK